MASSRLNMPQHASTCTAKEKWEASTSTHRCPAKLEGFAATPSPAKWPNAQCDDPAGAPLRHKYLGYLTEIMPTQRSLHATGGCIGCLSFEWSCQSSHFGSWPSWYLMIASRIRRLHGFALSWISPQTFGVPAATARIPGCHLPAMLVLRVLHLANTLLVVHWLSHALLPSPSKVWRQGNFATEPSLKDGCFIILCTQCTRDKLAIVHKAGCDQTCILSQLNMFLPWVQYLKRTWLVFPKSVSHPGESDSCDIPALNLRHGSAHSIVIGASRHSSVTVVE